MKYSKEAVVERVEHALAKIRENEEDRYQNSLKEYRKAVDLRNKRRTLLFKLVDNLKGFQHRDRVEDDVLVEKLLQKFREVGRLAHGYSTLEGDEYIGQVLGGAGMEIVEPVRSTARSDDLQSVLDVFKTGAPPEVSVNDLRAFGLMNFLKYRG